MKKYILALLGIVLLFSACQKEELKQKHSRDISAELAVDLRHTSWGEPIANPCDIKIFVENCEGSDWNNSIQDALEEYNVIGTVHMELTNDKADADILIGCRDDFPFDLICLAGTGNVVENSEGIREVFLNSAALESGVLNSSCYCEGDPMPLTPCQLQLIIMHELGHALGFYHTDTSPGTVVFGNIVEHIPGTPILDPSSIFNSGGANEAICNNVCSFPKGDRRAIKALYQVDCSCVQQTASGPVLECNCYDPKTIGIFGPQCLQGEETYCLNGTWDEITWNIPSAIDIVEGQGSNCIRLNLDNQITGAVTISATVKVMDCTYTIERVLTTGQPNFDIVYNAPVCLGDVVRFGILELPAGQNLQVVDWYVPYGGLSILSQNSIFAVAEASSSVNSRICARARNDCDLEKTFCVNVAINADSNCTGDGQIPNPK